jgi:hypothetical protein
MKQAFDTSFCIDSKNTVLEDAGGPDKSILQFSFETRHFVSSSMLCQRYSILCVVHYAAVPYYLG